MDGLAGDVCIFVGDEKQRGAGDLVRRAGAAHGNLRDGRRPCLVGVVGAHARRFDAPRRDGVDVNTILRVFQGQRLGKRRDATFGGRIA